MRTTASLATHRRASWLISLCVAGGVLLLGWVAYGAVASSTDEQVEAQLRSTLAADAAAVDRWHAERYAAAERIASASSLDAESLEARARAAGAAGAVIASRDEAAGDLVVWCEDGAEEAWDSAAESVIRASRRGWDPPSLLRMRWGADLRVLLPAAAVDDDHVLFLIFDGATLASVIGPDRAGASGESFVVDEDGTLRTPSRFQADLEAFGIVPEDGPFELRDPGGHLRSGHVIQGAHQALPYTRLAAGVISKESGVDLDGYRNHLGVKSVGAWTWEPRWRLGVGTEMAYDEAFGPLHTLRTTLWMFGAMLAAAGAVAVIAAQRARHLQRKVLEAESEAKRLGQYTLVKKIGEGGMGEVHFARHAMLRRPTAIKLLRPDKTSEQTIARFEREVQQTSRLTHPNTIQIFDFGRTPGGIFYYAMEYLQGIPLDEFVEKEGPLDEARVLYILAQICASLNEAHELGLIHRDIKPANIALCRAGGEYDVVKVLDFGLVMDLGSKESVDLTQAGTITGTPAYMSPEGFLRPGSVDARSDIYAVGCVGYFLLTGKTLFEGDSVMEIVNKQLRERPIPPSERADRPILPDVEKALLACLEKEPARRPQNVRALGRELEWCRAAGEWNKAKARNWWRDHEGRLERTYGLSSKEPSGSSKQQTIAIDMARRIGKA